MYSLGCNIDGDLAREAGPNEPSGDSSQGGKQATPQPPAAPPTPQAGCGISSPASPSTCCPTGFTQLTGDGNANTWTRDTWDTADYCVFGYAAVDTAALGAGRDLVYGGNDNDYIYTQGGDDRVEGGSGNDTVRGGPGGDLLYGQAGDDWLNGDGGNDTIYGGTNADRIYPGAGVDASYGEDGNDVFVIGSPCEVGTGEVIDGGNGTDTVESPLTQAQLVALGVSFTSIETFTTVAYDHSECLVVDQTMGATAVVKPSAGPLVTFAPRDAGTVLAKTKTEVFSVASNGTLTSLQAGDRAYISPTGHSFAIQDHGDEELKIYDGSGALQGTLTGVAPHDAFVLFPTSDYILVPDVVENGPDSVKVDSVQILELDGTQRSQFSTPGLSTIHLTETHLIYTTDTTVRKVDLDGVEAWEVTRSVFDLSVTDGSSSFFIAKLQQDADHVYHFEEDGATTATAVDGTVWDVAMSPGGKLSAAIVHKSATVAPRLYVFAGDELVSAQALPLRYANSVDVNGEVFVGGQNTSDVGVLLAYHENGNLLWQQTTTDEKNGYRPLVVSAPGGDFLLAGQTRGLNAFAIDRSPTP